MKQMVAVLVVGLGLLACAGCSQGFYVINETGEELENVDVHSEFPWNEVTIGD